MKNFVRGAGVHISVTFKDKDGNVVTPDSASVTLSYMPLNSDTCDRTFLTYTMAANTDPGTTDWIYDWDSNVSEPGVVYATAISTTVDTPESKVDFEFRLTANRANKELAGDDSPGSGY